MKKAVFGTFHSHIHNGGIGGTVSGKECEGWWGYKLDLDLSNFAGTMSVSVNLQDTTMVDELIYALQKMREHMSQNNVASYI
jgi:hypothetical protein